MTIIEAKRGVTTYQHEKSNSGYQPLRYWSNTEIFQAQSVCCLVSVDRQVSVQKTSDDSKRLWKSSIQQFKSHYVRKKQFKVLTAVVVSTVTIGSSIESRPLDITR